MLFADLFAEVWLACAFNRLSRCSMRVIRRFAPRVPFFCKRLRSRA